MWETFKKKAATWIPLHVSPRLIVAVYWLLDIFSFMGGGTRAEHKRLNLKRLSGDETPLADGYIDDQKKWKDIKFGKADMAFSGCEIMAVYNILLSMGKGAGAEFMSDLISEFERSGAALKGMIGSSPRSVIRHLKRHGISCRLIWSEDKISDNVNRAIVMMYNDRRNLYEQIHTVAFIRENDGFIPHNARSRERSYATLKDAIHGVGTDPKTICIIEVFDRD